MVPRPPANNFNFSDQAAHEDQPMLESCSTAVHLSLEADADRLTAALHVEDLARSSRAVVLQVFEEDSTWIRVLLGDDDNAHWYRAT